MGSSYAPVGNKTEQLVLLMGGCILTVSEGTTLPRRAEKSLGSHNNKQQQVPCMQGAGVGELELLQERLSPSQPASGPCRRETKAWGGQFGHSCCPPQSHRLPLLFNNQSNGIPPVLSLLFLFAAMVQGLPATVSVSS